MNGGRSCVLFFGKVGGSGLKMWSEDVAGVKMIQAKSRCGWSQDVAGVKMWLF